MCQFIISKALIRYGAVNKHVFTPPGIDACIYCLEIFYRLEIMDEDLENIMTDYIYTMVNIKVTFTFNLVITTIISIVNIEYHLLNY